VSPVVVLADEFVVGAHGAGGRVRGAGPIGDHDRGVVDHAFADPGLIDALTDGEDLAAGVAS